MSTIEPGWYPDPSGEPVERRWDGGAWREDTRPATSEEPHEVPYPEAEATETLPATGTPPAQDGRQSAETGSGTRHRRGPYIAVGVGAVLLLAGVAGWAITSGGSGDEPLPTAVEDVEDVEDDGDDGDSATDDRDEDDAGDVDGEAEEATDPAELRDLDWTGVAWTTHCTVDGDLHDLHVDAAVGRVFGGYLEHDPAPTGENPYMVYGVDIAGMVYGDVTGDGHDDAIVPSECFLGNDFESSIEVWSHDPDGAPLHLPPVLSLTKFDGYVDAFEVTGDRLRITTREAAPGATHPHLDGYPVEAVTDWWYDSQRWLSEQISWEEKPEDPVPSEPEMVWTSGFQLPSGNITCVTESTELDCWIASGLTPRPSSEDCPWEWAALTIRGSGPAEPLCADRASLPSQPVLEYGELWTDDRITCSSSEFGLSCWNTSGGGLELARTGWDAW